MMEGQLVSEFNPFGGAASLFPGEETLIGCLSHSAHAAHRRSQAHSGTAESPPAEGDRRESWDVGRWSEEEEN